MGSDLEELEKMITPNTKMIVLNSPNNPTGKIIQQREIESILSWLGKITSLF